MIKTLPVPRFPSFESSVSTPELSLMIISLENSGITTSESLTTLFYGYFWAPRFQSRVKERKRKTYPKCRQFQTKSMSRWGGGGFDSEFLINLRPLLRRIFVTTTWTKQQLEHYVDIIADRVLVASSIPAVTHRRWNIYPSKWVG